MNNIAQLKERERTATASLLFLLLFCFVFANHTRNAFFSSIGMCCLCLFFYETMSLRKKIHSKFVKPWEMKNLPSESEKVSETVRYTVKSWELGRVYKYICRCIYRCIDVFQSHQNTLQEHLDYGKVTLIRLNSVHEALFVFSGKFSMLFDQNRLIYCRQHVCRLFHFSQVW